MSGLKVRAYHGMASNYSQDEIERYDVFGETGWSSTRLSGILAMLLMYYPNMPYAAIAAFASANGADDWEFTVDKDDYSPSVGGSGKSIYFVEGYELPSYSEWSADFKAWQAGEEVSQLPPLPVTASVIDNEFDDFTPPTIQPPAAVYEAQPAFEPPPAAMQPAVYHPESQFSAPAKPGQPVNWLPWALGAALLYFAMKKKKKR